jgi:hypothetical protein
MTARAAALVALLILPAAASATEIGFRDVRVSAPLSAWDLGRVRRYLESAATACALASKRSLGGEYAIALALDAGGRPRHVGVGGGRRMARCLGGSLRDVRFPAGPEAYTWDGVLRVGATPGLSAIVRRFAPLSALREDTLRNTILARLEALPACARAALADGGSVALRLSLRAEADGALAAPPKVEPSTVATEALAGCLAEHLASLRFPPSHTYTRVKMSFHLVQTAAAPADGPALQARGE